jgi:hypothetical protein
MVAFGSAHADNYSMLYTIPRSGYRFYVKRRLRDHMPDRYISTCNG